MRYVIRERFFRLGEDSDITDDAGRPVFHVDGKVFSLHSTLVVRDMAGNEVAVVRKRLISLTPTYEVTRPGQGDTTIRKQLFHLFGDRFMIDIPGPDDLEATGNIFDHDYSITRDGREVAHISKAWISLTDTYGVDIAPGEDDVLILASALALDLAEDAERAHD